MDSARTQLARHVLETLAHGDSVSFNDAIQLRNWAVRPEWLLGNGDGTFQPEVTFIGDSGSFGLGSLIAADFNQDGRIDLAGAGVTVLLNISQTASSTALGSRWGIAPSPSRAPGGP
jgi:hypothetical protein